jgi:hypothetical protein
MAKRESVPPVRRPRDMMFTPAEPAPAPTYVKTSAYVRPEQLAKLDDRRASHRAAGRRTVSGSDLVRAALDLAERHGEEWDQLVADTAAAR